VFVDGDFIAGHLDRAEAIGDEQAEISRPGGQRGQGDIGAQLASVTAQRPHHLAKRGGAAIKQGENQRIAIGVFRGPSDAHPPGGGIDLGGSDRRSRCGGAGGSAGDDRAGGGFHEFQTRDPILSRHELADHIPRPGFRRVVDVAQHHGRFRQQPAGGIALAADEHRIDDRGGIRHGLGQRIG